MANGRAKVELSVGTLQSTSSGLPRSTCLTFDNIAKLFRAGIGWAYRVIAHGCKCKLWDDGLVNTIAFRASVDRHTKCVCSNRHLNSIELVSCYICPGPTKPETGLRQVCYGSGKFQKAGSRIDTRASQYKIEHTYQPKTTIWQKTVSSTNIMPRKLRRPFQYQTYDLHAAIYTHNNHSLPRRLDIISFTVPNRHNEHYLISNHQ